MKIIKLGKLGVKCLVDIIQAAYTLCINLRLKISLQEQAFRCPAYTDRTINSSTPQVCRQFNTREFELNFTIDSVGLIKKEANVDSKGIFRITQGTIYYL